VYAVSASCSNSANHFGTLILKSESSPASFSKRPNAIFLHACLFGVLTHLSPYVISQIGYYLDELESSHLAFESLQEDFKLPPQV